MKLQDKLAYLIENPITEKEKNNPNFEILDGLSKQSLMALTTYYISVFFNNSFNELIEFRKKQ